MIAVGVLSLFGITHLLLKSAVDQDNEEFFIFPKIVISGISGLFFAGLSDSLFKIREYHEFRISGITFYGGIIGAALCLYVFLKYSKSYTRFSITEWFDKLTLPLISFHFFGRIGCFLGGCCYGKNTESFLGVLFPDNPENNIFHYGKKCYPTQLFEAGALLIIFIIILCVRKKFKTYVWLYAAARFIIEFFRGDDRGYIIKILSPAQLISLLLIISLIIHDLYKAIKLRKSAKT